VAVISRLRIDLGRANVTIILLLLVAGGISAL
jgi:hypothetical protein